MTDNDAERTSGSRSSWKKALRLYTYVKPYWATFLLGLFFLVLSSAANLAFPKFLGDLVDAAQGDDVAARVREIALTLLLILVGQAVFSFFRVVLFVNVTQKTLAALRQATYRHLIRLPMTFFNQRRVGELNSRISADISLLQETFTTTLAEFIRQVIIIFGGIAILLFTSTQLTLFMLAIVPGVVLIAVFFGRFIRRYAKDVQGEVAQSNTIVEETLAGVANVKAFANEFLEITRYRKKTDEVARIAMRGGIYRGAFSSFIILGLFGAIVAVIWRGVSLISAGEIAVGELFSFVIYSGFIGGSIGGFANVYASIQKAIGATEELMEVLDEEPEDLQSEKGSVLESFKGEISFEKVSFHYASRPDVPVLEDLSFRVSAGQQVALVGPSGAGKSTVVSLLLQFYQPVKGQISFDGQAAREYPLHALRNQMAVVPQEVFLFGGSIRENIAYGKAGATENEVVEAARQANAWEFIQKFPEGLDTIVGERGVQLSGGQRQRIAIARAVLKDPRILILDEATSSLDSESERLVQEALNKLMRNRSSLIIAHRLSTVRNADQILVLDQGRLVEQGKHQELMQRENGLYQNLRQLQLKED